MARPLRWLMMALLALAIGLVFAAYLKPAFMVDLANRWIFC